MRGLLRKGSKLKQERRNVEIMIMDTKKRMEHKVKFDNMVQKIKEIRKK